MPIQVRYLNDPNQECVIRPAPLVSISHSVNKTGGGDSFGGTYQITLTGKILEDRGFPLARRSDGTLFEKVTAAGNVAWGGTLKGPYETFDTTVSHYDDNRPATQAVPNYYKLDAILSKQKALRALFAIDGQRLEVTAVHGNEPEFVCYPRVVSISFSEGIYVNQSDYTITLEADTILDYNHDVDHDGNPLYLKHDPHHAEYNPMGSGSPSLLSSKPKNTQDILEGGGFFIESFDESWSIEADESLGETITNDANGGQVIAKSYRLTHTMSATGKPHYFPNKNDVDDVIKVPAWKNAQLFVNKKLQSTGHGEKNVHLLYPNVRNHVGSGTMSLIEQYRGYDHSRTEEVSISNGSYNVTETWLLASGTAYENFNMNISSEVGSPFISVSIDGSIKGLSESGPSGVAVGGRLPQSPTMKSAYGNALEKYRSVSNDGKFGIGSQIYKRANNAVAVELNSQPNSISLAQNEYDGTITYNLSFDNRPTNILSGVMSESISVNDTYPGDVFAIIPVIGRKQGPVLQYIGGRTEYKRDLSLELVLDYTDVSYERDRKLLLQKPSLTDPLKTQLKELIEQLSPQHEPGVRKWFIAPPSESWTPKEGRYSVNISWTYELDK